MKRGLYSLIVGTVLLPAIAAAAPPAKVKNGNDAGPGSLRAALMSGATSIQIKPRVNTIVLESPLLYTGTGALTIKGTGQTIATLNDFGLGLDPMLTIANGADLTISGLTFDAGGGDEDGPWERLVNEGGGNAIRIDVPNDATGEVTVRIRDLVVRGTGDHGILISDCESPQGSDACGDGNDAAGDGSAASINVHLNNVLIERSGFGTQDADGLRVNERNAGDIRLFASNSTFTEVGADGIELDEAGPGDVIIDVRNTGFTDNGEYCLIGEFIPGDDCDDDGDPDVDDGFDIDEAGDGSILGKLTNVQVIENFDEGLDFDEAGMGGTDLVFVNITGIDNADESIKVSEEGPGDNIARLSSISETGDLEFEEAGMGSVYTRLTGSSIGDDFKFVEEDDGIVDIVINGSTVADTLEIESDDGDASTIDAFVRARGSDIGEIDPVAGTVVEDL